MGMHQLTIVDGGGSGLWEGGNRELLVEALMKNEETWLGLRSLFYDLYLSHTRRLGLTRLGVQSSNQGPGLCPRGLGIKQLLAAQPHYQFYIRER